MALVMGVDSSTQSCKVVITDAATGAVVREGRASHPNGTEVDPAAWWTALQGAIADAGGLDDVDGVGDRRPAARHGRPRRRRTRHPPRPAVERHPLGRSRGRPDRASSARRPSRSAPDSCPWRPSRSPSCGGCATHEPDNAARVAAVALPHDWLTWRLRGFGPEGESPRGPVLDELVTDRSDASGTGYWNPATGGYDRELLVAALGHDAILPRVLGPDEWVARRGRPSRRRREPATTPAPPSAWAPVPATSWSRSARAAPSSRSASSARSTRPARSPGFADCTGRFLPLVATLNAARVLDAIARPARCRPRRAQPARARRRARCGRPRRWCRTSRASARRTCPMPRHRSPA